MSDTMRKAFNSVRNFAEDTLERVERRWDQAMDVIHARPIRDSMRDDALGGGEQFAAQARERLDYQLRHPGPGEIAERHADLASDATVDKSQIDKIIRQEVGQARKEAVERFDINAPWRENLPQVNMNWMAEADRKQMEVDPGYRNEIGRASEERYSQDLARRSSTEIANGWTQKEATEMFEHLSNKYENQLGTTYNADSESVRKAERMADATDPMHDGRREQQADNYKRQETTVNHEPQHNRQRESMAWTKVEEIGRQAVAADRAAQTQTQTQAQTPKSKADEDLEKAKPRQSQTP